MYIGICEEESVLKPNLLGSRECCSSNRCFSWKLALWVVLFAMGGVQWPGDKNVSL